MKQTKAFTLIELSIVVVIIGLIVAGVVAGQSLVRQAQLRSILSERQQYDTAINTFFLQYNALPGDITNASAYWAGASNGNGNRLVESSPTDETTLVWNHLYRADIISSYYTGVYGSGHVAGVNIPKSSLSGGGWHYKDEEWFEANVDPEIARVGYLVIGAFRNASIHNTSILTPAEAKSIDDKSDDGIPHTGSTKVAGGYDGSPHSSDCTSGVGGASTFDLTFTTKECIILFVTLD